MTGSKLQPESRKKQQPRESLDKEVRHVLLSLYRGGRVATKESYNRLSRWLTHLATGSETDYRTPFFTERNSKTGKLAYRHRSEIVSEFDEVYSELLAERPLVGYLHDIEVEQRELIGPMSPYLPFATDGPDKIAAVYSDKKPSAQLDRRALDRALDRLQSLVPTQSCELTSLDVAINGTGDGDSTGLDTTTNSGEPFWIRPWKPHDDLDPVKFDEVQQAHDWYVNRVRELYSVLSDTKSTSELPTWGATVAQRLVQKGPEPFNPKGKRMVIAFPKEEAILGKMAIVTLMEGLKEARTPWGSRFMSAWYNMPTVDITCNNMLHKASQNNLIVNGSDFSGFDASAPPWLLWEVAQIISTWSQNSQFVRNLLYMSIYKTELITPIKHWQAQPSSVKSGSSFTNMIGSCFNMLAHFYGEEIGNYELKDLCVLGDDAIAVGPGLNPDSFTESVKDLNLTAHPDKQFYHPDSLLFLQRFHSTDRIGGVASVYRTLASVLSLERLSVKPKDWNKFAYVVQALSRLENAAFHPYFTELVEFVASGDKLQLGRNMDPSEILTGAGDAGEEFTSDDSLRPWKQTGEAVSFTDWPVNGVLRGEELPSESETLFRRVYGDVESFE